MQSLRISGKTIEVHDARVRREADRMFRMSAERRQHRVEGAKRHLARAIKAKVPESGLKKFAARILSQGSSEA